MTFEDWLKQHAKIGPQPDSVTMAAKIALRERLDLLPGIKSRGDLREALQIIGTVSTTWGFADLADPKMRLTDWLWGMYRASAQRVERRL